MLDEYIHGDVSRISPEAPVPVLKANSRSYEPGGAANVAANIAALGGKCYLFGFVGDDVAGKRLESLLRPMHVDCYFDENEITTLKIRPIGKEHQLLRIDFEDTVPKQFGQHIMDEMRRAISQSGIILVSDYAKGAITPELMDYLRSTGKKIIVDPKPKNAGLYQGVYLLKMNRGEAVEMSGEREIQEAGRLLRRRFGSDIIVTLGEEGFSLFSDEELALEPYSKCIGDVTGAGDSFISALSLSLGSGASLKEAAMIANHAAGIAVSNVGTYQVKSSELRRSIQRDATKLKSLEELTLIVDNIRRQGQKIVWTNGCFDILHSGHVRYLTQAKSKGDYLVVGINSDESIKRIKGPTRPINSVAERAEVLSSLSFVDAVIVFGEDDCIRQIGALKPEVYVKGGDYKSLDEINQPERRLVESYGGKICLVDLVPGVSTTRIIERMKDNGK